MLFLLSYSLRGQTNITFNYDTAGNQLIRELCLSGCSNQTEKKDLKDLESIKDEDLEKFSSEDVISYYPNPVKEELYLKWELNENNYVYSISIYSVNGEILKKYPKSANVNTENISFQNYPLGVYIVSLLYDNGEKKTIKIIKK